MKFYILTTGWVDSAPFHEIKRCATSVNVQTCQSWYHRIVVDGCVAPGHSRYAGYLSDRLVKQMGVVGKRLCYTVHQRLGAAYNQSKSFAEDWEMGNVGHDDVVVWLDADDQLMPNCLDILSSYYKDAETWVVYGSYLNCPSNARGRFAQKYEAGEDVRGTPWKASHVRSMKAWLYREVLRVGTFVDCDGNWIMAGVDVATMLPAMELAGMDRVKFNSEPVYIYNSHNLNDHRTNPIYQKEIENWIRKQPSLKRLTSKPEGGDV